MARFIVQCVTVQGELKLAFDRTNTLTCIGTAERGRSDLLVYSYDPRRDVFYDVPGELSAAELAEEVRAHFPAALANSDRLRVHASQCGGRVLLQPLPVSQAPVLSPLVALRILIERAGDVNSAVLEADNAALLVLHKAGESLRAHGADIALTDLLQLDRAESRERYPWIDADEMLLSGHDVASVQAELPQGLEVMRRLDLADLSELCGFTEEAAKEISPDPARYALAIGAAAAFDDLLRAALETREASA